MIERNAVGQSQRTQLKYAATLRSRLDSLLSLGLASPNAEASRLYDEIVSWKGMTLMRQRAYRLAGDDARTRPILESLTSVSQQLAAVLSAKQMDYLQQQGQFDAANSEFLIATLSGPAASGNPERRPVPRPGAIKLA